MLEKKRPEQVRWRISTPDKDGNEIYADQVGECVNNDWIPDKEVSNGATVD